MVDASVLANVVGDDGPDGELARGEVRDAGAIAAPDLVDVETLAILRNRWLAGTMSERRFAAALDDLEAIPVDRYPSLPLVRRGYRLRANITAYDAMYVALAEGLDCELLTGDVRLANAPAPKCVIRALRCGPRPTSQSPVRSAPSRSPPPSWTTAGPGHLRRGLAECLSQRLLSGMMRW